ncbi:hypothetical protein U1Q18_027766 [Sarracenia purpurea var. burkii]
MEAKPSKPSSSCFGSISKCCQKATEFICSSCLLCICCPIAIAWSVIKLPCKVGWRTGQYAMHRDCCGSEKRTFAAYSSFSDIDSDCHYGNKRGSKSLGASKSRKDKQGMISAIWHFQDINILRRLARPSLTCFAFAG